MSPAINQSDARMALLTAEDRGAVAVVRVWGPAALAVVEGTLRLAARPALAQTPSGRLRLGRIGAGSGDEVVVVRDGKSGEIEVQCHSGMQAVALVLKALEEAGAVRMRPDDWLRRSTASPLQAQAKADLSHAPTFRAAEILLEQVQGALGAEVLRLAGLADQGSSREEVLRGLAALRDRSRVGLRLLDGWRVVLAGRPNVGKSQLLNALAGFDRAIVDPTAGTTRDVVTTRTAIAGWPVELSDTAGFRVSDDPLEAAGIALGESRRARADLVVLVLDRSEPLTGADRRLLEILPDALIVANKADLPPAWSENLRACLPVSALTGDGIAGLTGAIGDRLVPEPPPPGAGVPFRETHLQILETANSLAIAGRLAEVARRLRDWLGPRVAPA